jgi:alpha-tubulin suppressor-like RCC1 family protein
MTRETEMRENEVGQFPRAWSASSRAGREIVTTSRERSRRRLTVRAAVALVLGAILALGSVEPAHADGPPEPVQVVVGADFSCARMSDGTVRCWGANDQGQLGDGTTIDRQSPVTVVGRLGDVRHLVAGEAHVCALVGSGSVKCWGTNRNYQVGDHNSAPFRTVPVDVTPVGVQFLKLDAGPYATCGATRDHLYCWGMNVNYSLGTYNNLDAPTRITAFTTAPILSLTVMYESVCLQVATFAWVTSLKCSGANSSGSWGGGPQYQSTPGWLTVGTFNQEVRQLDGHTNFLCRLQPSTGELFCAGENSLGQLGVGDTADHSTPLRVPGTFSTIGAGYSHMCAFAVPDNEYRCWGASSSGQLGFANTSGIRVSPGAVRGFGAPASAADASIAAGHAHTCAIGRDGTFVRQVYCWGSDSRGQLGNGIFGSASTPTRVGIGTVVINTRILIPL